MHHLVLKRPEPQTLPEREPQPPGGIHTAGLGLTFITRETAIMPHRNMHTHMQTHTPESLFQTGCENGSFEKGCAEEAKCKPVKTEWAVYG